MLLNKNLSEQILNDIRDVLRSTSPKEQCKFFSKKWENGKNGISDKWFLEGLHFSCFNDGMIFNFNAFDTLYFIELSGDFNHMICTWNREGFTSLPLASFEKFSPEQKQFYLKNIDIFTWK